MFYVVSSDVQGILTCLDTQGFLPYIIILRLDVLVVFERLKSTLVDLKNQHFTIDIFFIFKRTRMDFAHVTTTNASRRNTVMFRRKP